MSEGKASSVRVVSEEELRRRRVAAARDRLTRATIEYERVSATVRAAERTYGDLGVGAIDLTRRATDDPDHLEADAERFERAALDLGRRVGEMVVDRREAHFAAAVRDLAATFSPIAPLDPLAPRRPTSREDGRAGDAASAAAIASRLSVECAVDEHQRCDALVRDVASESEPTRRAVLVSALRQHVQAVNQAVERERRNRERASALEAELDGLAGEAVERMRGKLRGLDRRGELPVGLEEEVRRVRDGAIADRDRRFVLEQAADVLRELGYDVDGDFVASVSSAEGRIVPIGDVGTHGMRLRARDGRLLANLVRFDVDGRLDPSADGGAAETMCSTYAEVERLLADRGIDTRRDVDLAPGSGNVEVRREAPIRRTDRSRRERARERR